MKEQLRLNARDKNRILESVLNKYRYDRDRLKAALPEVVDRLDDLSKPVQQKAGSSFGLTELEATHQREKLNRLLQKLQQEPLNREEAATALEAWGALVYGGRLDEGLLEEKLWELITLSTGLDASKVTRRTTKVVRKAEAPRHIPIVRGVTLNMTWDMHLASITIDPKELSLRRKALMFVGMASDSARDVAEKHDEYLAGSTIG
jgi:hypothetical protein